MKPFARAFLCFAIGAASLAAAILPARGQAPPPSNSTSPLPDAEIRKILAERIDVEHKGVGIVVGIVTPAGRRIIAYGRLNQGDKRPLDGDTVFEIGSITKVFTSLLLSDMIRRGEVSLTDPVGKFLPEGVRVPEWRGRKIMLVDLATQTSGLPFFPTNYPLIDDVTAGAKEFSTYPLGKLYEFLNSYELLHDIGVNWEYSNLGVGLLGFALARRAGMDFEALVKARIAGPLGMKSTAVEVSRGIRKRLAVGHDGRLEPTPALHFPDFMAGAGSLRSTANDLLTFLEAFLGIKKTPLAAAMSAMLETRRPGADWLAFLGGQQALGWWVIGKGDDQIIAHAGDTLGFSCSAAYNPKTRVGAVALSNGVSGGEDLAMRILRPSYPQAKPGPQKTHKEIAVDPNLFDLYAGKYQVAPNVIVVIGREGDKLWFMAPGSPRVRLRAEGERDYFIPQSDVQVTFKLDDQGRVTGLILHLYSQYNFPGKRLNPGPGK